MSWTNGDEITASKLNSENHTPSWNFSWSDPNSKTTTTGTYLFYVHNCGGTYNPIIIDWYINVYTTYSWGNYGPDLTIWIEKRQANGTPIKRYTICDFENKTDTWDGEFYYNELTSYFGSAEGWYYIYAKCEGDKHGGGSVAIKAYGYPPNSAAGRPLRYYNGPTSNGFTIGKQLSVENLNNHKIGTY
jgi:hypothetical protein